MDLRLVIAAAALVAAPAFAQDACKSRGELDTLYCDANGDLLADTPADPKRWKDPDTILFSNSPLDDLAIFHQLMQPYVDYLGQCTGKKVRYYDVFSSAAAIEAMRSGRMHVGTMSSEDTAFAVNVAGDLKGKKVAHTTPSSNSGNLAPRALFPAEGLVPDVDYKPQFSGKHENSVSGVASGDYDAAAIAHDILIRMADRGVVKMDDFRIIWKSQSFAPGGILMAHDLAPALQKKIRECSYAFKFPPEMVKGFQGADRWLPIDYKKDWALVRKVAESSGQSFTRDTFDKEKARAAAAEAAKKK